jgi:alkyl hydroperoxide reductase subunit AhpC
MFEAIKIQCEANVKMQYVREHGGEVCPAKWQPGDATLKPGLDLVGKI